MKTYSVKKNEIERKWYLIDAKDIRLGRLASQIAAILMGKGKVEFTRNLPVGDEVIVINAKNISVSGNKKETKKYYKHTGYIGSLKEETLGNLLERKPEEVIQKAVSGMLPKNKLRSLILKNLHVYSGGEHKHEAQKPIRLEIK